MTAFRISLQVLLAITGMFLVLLVLLHKGKGGGMSDMFGGGMSSAAGSSGVAERNLNIITVVMAGLWSTVVVLLGVLERFSPS